MKTIPIKAWTVYIASAMFLFSCRMENIALEILYPAEITLPDGAKNLVVVNRSKLSPNAYEEVNRGSTMASYQTFSEIAAEEAIWTSGELLSGFDRLFVLIADTIDIRPKTADIPLRLTPQQVSFYKDLYKADLLLALEGFRVNVESNGTVTTVLETDEFGNTFEVPFFRERRIVNVEALWRLYDLVNDTVIFKRKITSRQNFLGQGFSQNESFSSMPDKGSSILMVAAKTGEDIVAPIIPFWDKTVRRLFVNYNDDFIDAFALAYVGNWVKAYEIWEEKLKKGKKNSKRQAAYNITVALEALEFFDQAYEMNNSFYKKYKHQSFKKRKKELEQRFENERLLDIQFGKSTSK